jgi:hypothetical protein
VVCCPWGGTVNEDADAFSGTGGLGAFGEAGVSGLLSFAAPVGYQAGDPIFASATFNNKSFSDFGLPSSGSGTIDFVSVGAPENVNWTINGVPEPSTYALLGGLIAIGFVLSRRGRQ